MRLAIQLFTVLIIASLLSTLLYAPLHTLTISTSGTQQVNVLHESLSVQITDLQDKLRKVETERDKALKGSSHTVKATHPVATATSENYDDPTDFCSAIPQPVPRTPSLWRRYAKQLLEWSIHPYDEDRVFAGFTAEILNIMTPERLHRGVKSIPDRQQDSIQSILEVLQERRSYIQANVTHTPDEPPPLRILVLGGSVVDGDKCNPIGIARLEQRRRKCAWPFRLEFMLNRILGDNVVNITAAALGGTNTESALTMLEYDLVPVEVDVIINAYSTNDMHLHSLEQAQKDNTTLRDRIFDISERFIVKALQRCRPSKRPSPLVVYFDDYLGNEHPVIRDTAVVAETIPWLANYYGILAVSYADAVRDIVYGDTKESWFSPQWFKRKPRFKVDFIRQVHPGMGMHIVSAWLLLYSLLDVALTHCATRMEPTSDILEGVMDNSTEMLPYNKPNMSSLRGLPPRLFPDTTLIDVSKLKADTSKACKRSERCIFAWVSRITSNCMWANQLNATMNQHLEYKQGWEAVYHYFKLGFEATGGLNSKFVLEFPKSTQPVSEIMLTVMKSYGEKWDASKVRLYATKRLQGSPDWRPIRMTNPEIVGYHDKNTSEQYSSVSVFRKGPLEIGSDLRLSIELVAGTTFKIMGMAICSSS